MLIIFIIVVKIIKKHLYSDKIIILNDIKVFGQNLKITLHQWMWVTTIDGYRCAHLWRWRPSEQYK